MSVESTYLGWKIFGQGVVLNTEQVHILFFVHKQYSLTTVPIAFAFYQVSSYLEVIKSICENMHRLDANTVPFCLIGILGF